MKISVSKIPEGGMNLRFEKDWKWFRDFLPEAEPADFVLDRIKVTCNVRRMKETVFIEGSVATTLEAPCGRCLAMTALPISSLVQLHLLSASRPAAGRVGAERRGP